MKLRCIEHSEVVDDRREVAARAGRVRIQVARDAALVGRIGHRRKRRAVGLDIEVSRVLRITHEHVDERQVVQNVVELTRDAGGCRKERVLRAGHVLPVERVEVDRSVSAERCRVRSLGFVAQSKNQV